MLRAGKQVTPVILTPELLVAACARVIGLLVVIIFNISFGWRGGPAGLLPAALAA